MIKLKSLISESEEDDFLQHHKTGWIPSDAYDNYEKPGGLSWIKGGKERHSRLLDKGTFGPFEVEFRATAEKCEYTKTDAEGEIVRDARGIGLSMTPEEIKAKNLPEFDTSIVAYVDNTPVGLASNEFGAVGIWVEKAYQGHGIGTALLAKHVDLRPNMKSGQGKFGQMTNAGERMTRKYFRNMAQKHGKDWFNKLRSKV